MNFDGELLPPVAIGGVGGSGTRLVAELVRELGVDIGQDCNDCCDTLWFTLLFKRREILEADDDEIDWLVDAFVAALRGGHPLAPETEQGIQALAASDRLQHPAPWLKERARSMTHAAAAPAHGRRWGWKEPNTHLVIERLLTRLPTLRYIHVVRHGLDMALSSNQNQLQFWGPVLLGEDGPITPERSLAFWCLVHHRMQEVQTAHPERFYWLDYDALCSEPEHHLPLLARFLGQPVQRSLALRHLIIPPPMARRSAVITAEWAAADLEYVRSLGYQTHTF